MLKEGLQIEGKRMPDGKLYLHKEMKITGNNMYMSKYNICIFNFFKDNWNKSKEL